MFIQIWIFLLFPLMWKKSLKGKGQRVGNFPVSIIDCVQVHITIRSFICLSVSEFNLYFCWLLMHVICLSGKSVQVSYWEADPSVWWKFAALHWTSAAETTNSKYGVWKKVSGVINDREILTFCEDDTCSTHLRTWLGQVSIAWISFLSYSTIQNVKY